MKVLRIFLYNTGVHKKRVIEFTDNNGNFKNFICLAGVNGTGKTTLFDLIENLGRFLNRKVQLNDFSINIERENVLSLVDFVQIDFLIDNKIISVVIGDEKYIQNDNTKEQMFIIENNVKEIIRKFEDDLKSQTEEKNISMIEKTRFEFYSREFAKRAKRLKKTKNNKSFFPVLQEISNNIDKNLIQNQTNLPFIYYFSDNDKKIIDTRYKILPKYELRYDIVHKYSPSQDDLKGLLVYFDYAFNDKYLQLVEWINKNIFEDKEILQIDRPNFNVLIKTNTGDTHNIDYLSSGEKSILVILVNIFLFANEQSIILIDEIEKSLHPQFQEKLLNLIKKLQKERGFQVIISAHSRKIWEDLQEDEIIDLTK
ncbi:MAG: hypothetical protein A2086_07640 [Spirochaetes bacterium GWD1_27_9]|nr:MAG: hypothetical protein A2Z98_10440 [Spirochaetes bacterium GWB1_27_13]OHD26508.1 MAG: hypothetical protein A2Y34_12915 [Spirochaetes bacterium GWC1_27_15]OHD44803.1 MAG: hypothetical protein A2086_07640 [Spirochaetes bacterium GWD1_27_9]